MPVDCFSRCYDVETDVTLLASLRGIPMRHYPSEQQADSLMVMVVPHQGVAWLGSFMSGPESPAFAHGVYGAPDPSSVCVIVHGEGYVVNAVEPERWMKIPVFPITAVHAFPQEKVQVFADFTHVAAFGESGLLWVTRRVSWDGIQITGISEGNVLGLAWDATTARDVPLSIALADGRVIRAPYPSD